MHTVSIISITLIGLEHFAFMVLEMFFWNKPIGRRIFKQSLSQAKQTETLAANQGLYNGFLASSLFWGLLHPNQEIGLQISIFFLICIVIAGIYGAYSAHKKILFVQALPGFLTLVTLFIL